MANFEREVLEDEIGPPDEFIISTSNIRDVRKWAIAAGYLPVEVNAMSNVQLANLYHEGYGKDKREDDIQKITSDIFVKIMQTIQVPGWNADMIAAITRENIESEGCRPALLRIATEEIRKAVDAMPPKQIQVITPQSSVIIDGPVHYLTEKIIRIAALNHPIMLVGPAGCGKTTIGNHVAKALDLPFYITSTITDTHELTGFVDGYGKYHSTPFRQAFEFGGLWIADEIDAWDASALLAANSALANGYSVFPDKPKPIARHENFRMLATANTFGSGADRIYVGRNELDAASLDRFATVNVDYDLSLEQIFSNGNQKWLERVWRIRKLVNEKKIRHVVSSRAIAMGSTALSIGMSWDDVEDIYLFKGMSQNDRDKIE